MFYFIIYIYISFLLSSAAQITGKSIVVVRNKKALNCSKIVAEPELPPIYSQSPNPEDSSAPGTSECGPA